MTQQEVDSGTAVQDSHFDGIFGTKSKDFPSSSSIISMEDMETRMLQVPQNTNVIVKTDRQPGVNL